MTRRVDLAQVEEELRHAETFLSPVLDVDGTWDTPTLPLLDGMPARSISKAPRVALSVRHTICLLILGADGRNEYGQRRLDAEGDVDKQEERRREILAKLSAERRAVRMGYRAGSSELDAGHAVKLGLYEAEHGDARNDDGSPRRDDAYERQDMASYGECGPEQASSAASDTSDDGGHSGQLFFASDLLDASAGAEIPARSALDCFMGQGMEDSRVEDDRSSVASSSGCENCADQDHGERTAIVGQPEEYCGIKTAETIAREVARGTDLQTQDENETPTPSPPSSIQHSTAQPAVPESLEPSKCDDDPDRDWHFDMREPPVVAVSTRIDRLAQPRTIIFAEREKQRLRLEMEQLRECTFHPNVCADRSAQQNSSGKRVKKVRFQCSPQQSSSSHNVFSWLTLSPRHSPTCSREAAFPSRGLVDRLNLDVAARYEQRERAREAMEQANLRECSFRPKINPLSETIARRSDYKPIHERISDLQRAKHESIRKIREQRAIEQGGLSFTPQINPRSREIAESLLIDQQIAFANIDLAEDGTNGGILRVLPVSERLNQEADTLARKRVALQECVDELESEPFAPQISKETHRLVKQRPEFRLDFVSRQEVWQKRDLEKRQLLEDQAELQREATFHPNIGNAEQVLERLCPDRVRESPQERLYRMTYYDPKQRELKRQQLREQALAKCSFKPEINEVSKALATSAQSRRSWLRSPSPTIPAKRTAREQRDAFRQYFAGKRFRSRIALEMEEARQAEYTFRPTLISKRCSSVPKRQENESEHAASMQWHSETLLQAIDARRQQRTQDLEAKRTEQQLKELKSCTFRPDLRATQRPRSADVMTNEAPVVVRGLGRFLELRERAKQRQEEQKLREEHVFRPNLAYTPRSYTIPKPFKLSTGTKDTTERRRRARDTQRDRERRECTFRPETIESQRRKVIRNLLHE